jgi:hypothetical protein
MHLLIVEDIDKYILSSIQFQRKLKKNFFVQIILKKIY